MMNKNYIKKWCYCAGIRAIKTAAETALGYLAPAAVMGDVNWTILASASALSALISLLVNLKGLPEISMDDLTTEEEK